MPKVSFFKRNVINASKKQLKTNMTKAMTFASVVAKDLVRQPGTGRVYGSHRASAPHEAPASDTGRLLASISVSVNVGFESVTGVLSANTNYAFALEVGTESMEERPFLVPSIKNNKGQILKILGS